MSLVKLGLAALLGVWLSAATSDAAIRKYHFVETSSTPDEIVVNIEFAISSPVSASLGDGTGLIGSLAGLEEFNFFIRDSLGGASTDIRQFGVPPGCLPGEFSCRLRWTVEASDRGLFVLYNDGVYDFQLGGAGGGFNTNFTGPPACRTTGACKFSGFFVAEDVPEPASLALLGFGVASIAMRRRSRKL